MELSVAERHIRTCLAQMRASYLQTVFDEWAILAVPAAAGGVLIYEGPRPEKFRGHLPDDAELLRAQTAGKQFAEGDIEFAAEAVGTRYDAFMKIGATSYLVLNHTGRTMAEIRRDAKWLDAQAALFGLSEKFRADPLEL